jgi:hypothetical protein
MSEPSCVHCEFTWFCLLISLRVNWSEISSDHIPKTTVDRPSALACEMRHGLGESS